jgi:ferric-dicitrate binding protein FerR (iron transport regulator)
VKSGRVHVRNLTTAKVEIITPGYTAKIEHDHLIKFQTKNPNYLSWKTGSFKFNHTPLKQVISDLNTYYDKKIVIDEKKPVDCNLTAQFNQTSQQDILNIIKLTCTCEIRENEDRYYVYAIKSNKP